MALLIAGSTAAPAQLPLQVEAAEHARQLPGTDEVLHLEAGIIQLCLEIPAVFLREIMMGVGNRVASVIMLTFPSEPFPHADFYK